MLAKLTRLAMLVRLARHGKVGKDNKVGKARSGKAGNGGKASEAQPAKFFNHGKIGYCQITPSVYNTFLRTRKGAPRIGRFLGSSTAEHPAVNRRVVGSNPNRGAIFELFAPVYVTSAGAFSFCLSG